MLQIPFLMLGGQLGTTEEENTQGMVDEQSDASWKEPRNNEWQGSRASRKGRSTMASTILAVESTLKDAVCLVFPPM